MPVEGSEIDITPNKLVLYLVGGDIVARNITVDYGGSGIATLSIGTKIFPDGEGINVTYSVDSPFKIKSGGSVAIMVTINTSWAITPGVYIISLLFFGDEEGTSKSKNGKTTPYQSPPTPPGDDTPVDAELPDDEEEDDGILPEPVIITAKIRTGWMWLYGTIAAVLFAISIIALLILWKKKKEKEK